VVEHVSPSPGSGRAVPRRVLLAGLGALAGAAAGAVWPVDQRNVSGTGERLRDDQAAVGDDTELLNAMFACGGDVVVPARDYSVSVDESGACLVVGVPGTRIRFEQGAVVRLRPSSLGGYVVLSVSAADCRVSGGTIVGDIRLHSGEEGEWGHGVAVVAGADRCIVADVRSVECWGDGFYVGGAVTDVRLESCVAADNRRQGLSIVDAIRPRVVGGSYGGTGRLRWTAPASGIDLEPNPGGAVVEAVVEQVSLGGNRGHGLLVSARHGPVSATMTGCAASHNGDAGFMFDGAGTQLTLRDSSGAGNARGVAMSSDSTGITANAVVVSSSAGPGFVMDGTANRLIGCVATGNGGSGFVVRGSARGVVLDSCRGASNSLVGVVPDFDIGGAGTVLSAPRSAVGAGTASSAVVLRPGATGATVRDGAWSGTYAVTAYQDLRPTIG
jgi:hypothetical protein